VFDEARCPTTCRNEVFVAATYSFAAAIWPAKPGAWCGAMPNLSSEENRRLRRIERGLCRDDPQLAQLLSGPAPWSAPAPARASTSNPRPPRGSPASSSPAPHVTLTTVLVFVSMGLLLIAGGFLGGGMAMVLGGAVTLAILPLAVALPVLARRNDHGVHS
jgi:Protein of unknown function (DUF3040)